MLQSDAVSYAYRMWRREWRGPGKQFVSLFHAVYVLGQLLLLDLWFNRLANKRLLACDILGYRRLLCKDAYRYSSLIADYFIDS